MIVFGSVWRRFNRAMLVSIWRRLTWLWLYLAAYRGPGGAGGGGRVWGGQHRGEWGGGGAGRTPSPQGDLLRLTAHASSAVSACVLPCVQHTNWLALSSAPLCQLISLTEIKMIFCKMHIYCTGRHARDCSLKHKCLINLKMALFDHMCSHIISFYALSTWYAYLRRASSLRRVIQAGQAGNQSMVLLFVTHCHGSGMVDKKSMSKSSSRSVCCCKDLNVLNSLINVQVINFIGFYIYVYIYLEVAMFEWVPYGLEVFCIWECLVIFCG